MGLKKLFKKTRKALGLPALTLGTAAKLGAVIGTGGLGAGALALGTGALKSKLKNAAVGGIKQVVRTKAQKAQLKKIGTLAPPTIVGIKPPATTMPGGAKLKGLPVARRRKAAAAPKPTKVKRAKKAAPKAAKPSGAKRKAPTGGKDFKALSASWKAAGKPGKWIDWVKAH